MSRLRTKASEARFNSNLVRLRLLPGHARYTLPYWFQFQSGAIKTAATGRVPGRAKSFQFQSGAIKTFETSPRDCRYSRFQFQSGAIKTRVYGLPFIPMNPFQFQSGAIKTAL